MRKLTFTQVFDAAVWFPRTARGHGRKRLSRCCVEKTCGAQNPHHAHVKAANSPFGVALNGRQANVVLHMQGVR